MLEGHNDSRKRDRHIRDTFLPYNLSDQSLVMMMQPSRRTRLERDLCRSWRQLFVGDYEALDDRFGRVRHRLRDLVGRPQLRLRRYDNPLHWHRLRYYYCYYYLHPGWLMCCYCCLLMRLMTRNHYRLGRLIDELWSAHFRRHRCRHRHHFRCCCLH